MHPLFLNRTPRDYCDLVVVAAISYFQQATNSQCQPGYEPKTWLILPSMRRYKGQNFNHHSTMTFSIFFVVLILENICWIKARELRLRKSNEFDAKNATSLTQSQQPLTPWSTLHCNLWQRITTQKLLILSARQNDDCNFSLCGNALMACQPFFGLMTGLALIISSFCIVMQQK